MTINHTSTPAPRTSRRSHLASLAGAGALTALGVGWRSGNAVASSPPGAGSSAAAGEAMSRYLYSFALGDIDAATDAFAIDEFVDSFDFTAFLQRLQSYTPQNIPLPTDNPLNRHFNVLWRRGAIGGALLNQYFTIAKPELDRAMVVVLEGDEAVAGFVDDLSASMVVDAVAGLADHEIVDLAELSPELAAESANALENLPRREIVGADELVGVVARTTAGNRELLIVADAVRYGDAWYLDELGGHLGALIGLPFQFAGVVDAEMFYEAAAGASSTEA